MFKILYRIKQVYTTSIAVFCEHENEPDYFSITSQLTANIYVGVASGIILLSSASEADFTNDFSASVATVNIDCSVLGNQFTSKLYTR